MHTHSDKKVDIKSLQNQNDCKSIFHFTDNRIETVAQRKLIEIICNSQKANCITQLKALIDNSSSFNSNDLGRSKKPLQMKETIKGDEQFDSKGLYEIDFEERKYGDNLGMYGTITFTPQFENNRIADKIELVQICKMTEQGSNELLETSGDMEVKKL